MVDSEWRPLLIGELADRALQAVADVGQSLVGYRARNIVEAADLALFWAYAAETLVSPGADGELARAVDQLATSRVDASPPMRLFGGVLGVAWIANHVDSDGGGALADTLDRMLVERLACSEWLDDYDLISGLVGFGTYLLERRPRPLAVHGLTMVLDHLARLARVTPVGMAWRTPAHQVPESQRVAYPGGYYNLGLAHGIPGVVGFLASVALSGAAGDREDAVRDQLRGAVQFVLAHRQSIDEGVSSRYPWAVEQAGSEGPPARTAWCYGDLGIATILARAAVALDDVELARIAIADAVGCAKRPPARCAIRDAGLCHGSAGLAHLLNRMHQAWDIDASVADGARAWFERTLDHRRTGGFAGFPAFSGAYVPDASVLTGAAGVGLALMAAVGHEAPAWDRRLLIDVPSWPGSSAMHTKA